MPTGDSDGTVAEDVAIAGVCADDAVILVMFAVVSIINLDGIIVAVFEIKVNTPYSSCSHQVY